MKFPFKEIEKDWDEGKLQTVRSKIDLFLKEEKGSLEARLQVGQFYLHLHEFKSALQVIPLNEILDSNAPSFKSIEVECLVFAARLLNALGASSYAFELLEKIPIKKLEPFKWDIAGIYATNRRYDEAIPLYDSFAALDAGSTTENIRMHVGMHLTRSYTGVENYSKALEAMTKHLEHINDRDPTWAAPAYSILGEMHVFAQQPLQARKALEKSLHFYSKLPVSNNAAFATLWMGGCYALEGKHEMARALFKKAWKTHYRSGFHPESWLQIYYWMGLSEYLESKVFPETWLRLLTYPGSWPCSLSKYSFRKQIEKWAEPPQEAFVSIDGFSKKPLQKHIEMFADSQDYNSLTEQLLINLILAGKNGLPSFRAYELLWPKQVYSVSQMPKRFEQLCIRLRQEGVRLKSAAGQHVCLDSNISVHWMRSADNSFQKFINLKQQFKRSDVEKYFKVSKSRAAQMCQSWVLKGFIKKENSGRAVTYQALPKATNSGR